jgi:predicted acetyltransferase
MYIEVEVVMENCNIIFVDEKYREQYFDFLSECADDIRARKFDYYIPISNIDTFDSDIKKLKNFREGRDLPEGWVPASVYWLISENNNRIIGVVTIRHDLAGYLHFRGGHISYYIRPSERKKGYATKLLSLALEKSRELKLDKVMITCAKDNVGSAKTIQKNGGVLHSEDVEEGEVFQRYWIKINSGPGPLAGEAKI